MKQLIISVCTLFVLLSPSNAQNIATENHQLYGGLGNDFFRDVISLIENESQFIFTVGRTSIDSDLNEIYQGGTGDLLVVKFDESNNLIWSKNYGGSDQDGANSVIQTSDGGFIVVGFTRSSDGDVSENSAQFTQDVWVLKLSASGVLQWEQNYGGVLEDVGLDIITTSDGNYVLGSSAQSATGDNTVSQGNYDFWLIKIDGEGEVIWQEVYGGTDSENIQAIIETTDGGILSVGQTRSTPSGDVSENFGLNDFWVLKTDALGQLIWEQNFGGDDNDRAIDVLEDEDGNYLILGTTESNGGDVSNFIGEADVWLIKVTPNGDLIWEKTYGGANFDEANAFQVIPNSDGKILLSCFTASTDGDFDQNLGGFDTGLILIDSEGEIVESTIAGGSDEDVVFDLVALDNLQVTAVGTTRSGDGDLADFEPFGNRDNWIFSVLLNSLSIQHDDSQIGVKVYPNPSNGPFRVEAPTGIEVLEILSIEGKSIVQLDLVSGESQWDLNLDSGIYLLNFSGPKGEETQRLIIR